MRQRIQHIIPWAILLLLIALQLPFLEADPDLSLSGSRGAFTDEGLYSAQIRNLIQQGDLTLNEAPSTLITPLFSLFLYLIFSILGIELWIGRLAVLVISLGLIRWASRSRNYPATFSPFLLLLAGSSYVLFSYSHFCLAEILGATCIFAAIGLEAANFNRKTILFTLGSHSLLFAAFLLKLQFLYILPLLPMMIFLQFFLVDKTQRIAVAKQLLISVSILSLLTLVYYICWYLPNKALFMHIMSDATAGRFAKIGDLPRHLNFIFKALFWNDYQWLNTFCFLVLLPLGLWQLFHKKTPDLYKYLLLGAFCWLLLESHKLALNYYPTRYFVSFYLAIIVSNALILSRLWQLAYKWNWNQVLIGLLLFGVLIKNGIDYQKGLQSRAYTLKAVNGYLANYDFDKQVIMGPWAPSVSWKNKAITHPIWNNYFNDKAVFETFRPYIIVSEVDEEDSNQAFSSKGINLDAQADSIRYFRVGRWDLKLIWVKTPKD